MVISATDSSLDTATATEADYIVSAAPGGELDSIKLWLKADAGVTESSGNISAWVDQTAAGYSFTQNTSADQPSVRVAASNFNNSVVFDSSNTEFFDTMSSFDSDALVDSTSIYILSLSFN